jgi:hypothetical protein
LLARLSLLRSGSSLTGQLVKQLLRVNSEKQSQYNDYQSSAASASDCQTFSAHSAQILDIRTCSSTFPKHFFYLLLYYFRKLLNTKELDSKHRSAFKIFFGLPPRRKRVKFSARRLLREKHLFFSQFQGKKRISN